MEPLSILVIDDEPGIALLCKRVLTRVGFNVTSKTDPKEGVEFLRENSIDLLLVDIRMPEVDGFQVIGHAQRLQPGISILVMTGYGTVETAINVLRQGVDGLILKPFEQTDELVNSVRLALGNNQQKKDAARIHTLKPLFNVTESLLSETQRDRLLELILSATVNHLRCSNVGYYLAEGDGDLQLLAQHGKIIPLQSKLISSVDSSSSLVMINTTGPGDEAQQTLLTDLELGAAILVPIKRPSFRAVLYAARDVSDQPFSEADTEIFQILSRQAAVAMENSRLYAAQVEYVRKVEESQKALLQAEKMAAAGRLSASIAHEVNNPLQAVQNCLHLAGREDLPQEKRSEYFNLAVTELERLSVTVKRMLDLYRPGAISPEKVQVQEILQRVLDLMEPQFKDRGIEAKIDIPEKLPTVRAVASQIQQVFINLILNSFDAMPDGGIYEISARPVKRGVELFFRDNGPGIPELVRASIFEPFFSTKDVGTGLGLTVSYNIITSHGGSLELVADQGPGACFRIFLSSGG